LKQSFREAHSFDVNSEQRKDEREKGRAVRKGPRMEDDTRLQHVTSNTSSKITSHEVNEIKF